MLSAARHRCMIYSDSPQQQLPYIASLLLEELRAGTRCIYFHSPEMVAAMQAYLTAASIDVDAELDEGTLILSSERSYLANGRFDAATLLDMAGAMIVEAEAQGFLKLWVTGDISWEFGDSKDYSELLAYERGLDQLSRQHPMLHGICQYRQDALPSSALGDALRTHQSVYLNQALFPRNPFFTPVDAPPAPIPTGISDLLDHFQQQH